MGESAADGAMRGLPGTGELKRDAGAVRGCDILRPIAPIGHYAAIVAIMISGGMATFTVGHVGESGHAHGAPAFPHTGQSASQTAPFGSWLHGPHHG